VTKRRPHDVPADPTETVDADLDGHWMPPAESRTR
jgi:hypothetical protein